MKRRSKLSSEQQEQHASEQRQTQAQTAHEFASAEEVLRYDAAQTVVPPGIAQRLAESSAGIPAPNRPWWNPD